MTKKRKKREDTDNKKKKRTSQNCNSSKNTNKNSNENRKLSDFSYAELIILSATLAYSLAEELDEDDLAIFLIFLELLVIDMQAIETQKAIRSRSQVSPTEDLNVAEEDINIDLNL